MAKLFDHVSGSTDGQPIAIAATDAGSADTIHTAIAKDYVTIEVYNNDTVPRVLYVLWGHTDAAKALEYDVPAKKGSQVVVPRGFIDNSGVVKAYGEVTNKLFVLGNIESIS